MATCSAVAPRGDGLTMRAESIPGEGYTVRDARGIVWARGVSADTAAQLIACGDLHSVPLSLLQFLRGY